MHYKMQFNVNGKNAYLTMAPVDLQTRNGVTPAPANASCLSAFRLDGNVLRKPQDAASAPPSYRREVTLSLPPIQPTQMF